MTLQFRGGQVYFIEPWVLAAHTHTTCPTAPRKLHIILAGSKNTEKKISSNVICARFSSEFALLQIWIMSGEICGQTQRIKC